MARGGTEWAKTRKPITVEYPHGVDTNVNAAVNVKEKQINKNGNNEVEVASDSKPSPGLVNRAKSVGKIDTKSTVEYQILAAERDKLKEQVVQLNSSKDAQLTSYEQLDH